MDIHYRRPPGDERVFTQELVLDREDVKVTLARDVRFESPVTVAEEVILASGSDAVWFTFPGKWHDIGRFHLPDDTFTGIYANILTPPVFEAPSGGPLSSQRVEDPGSGQRSRDAAVRSVWRTTDLFLDVWIPAGGSLAVLDRDQLEEAEERGWIGDEEARRARAEVDAICAAHADGAWPPPVVKTWTLERAREASTVGS